MDIKNSGLDLTNYEIWYEPFWQTRNFYLIVFLVLGLITFILLALVFIKIKKNRNTQRTGIDLFCYKLDLLSKNRNNDIRISYGEVVLILKEYLSFTFNYDFFAKTDDEIIIVLKELNVSQEFVSELAPILYKAQIAKFANSIINKNQLLEDLIALEIVVKAVEGSKIKKE